MQRAIWEYLIPSLSEKEELWNRCVFVFDTNVLLNLYRYTANTRDTLLNAFEDLKDRIWLPYQVAYEYGKNRFDVIHETIDKYSKLEKSQEEFINQCVTELRLKHSDNKVQVLKKFLNTWIADQKKRNVIVVHASEDEILEKVLSIFDGKVGSPFSKEKIEEICIEGKERYEKQIPPGFCDAKKEKEGDINNAYGDLIVWKQILEFSASNHKDIIYITHDQKKDWWSTSKGRTLGPRIELRKEFYETTKQEFYMYSMEGFLEQYSTHKGQATDQSVIDEVNDIESVRTIRIRKNEEAVSEQAEMLQKDIIKLEEQIDRRQRAIISIQMKYLGKQMPQDIKEQKENTEKKIVQLQKQLADRQAKLIACQKRVFEYTLTY